MEKAQNNPPEDPILVEQSEKHMEVFRELRRLIPKVGRLWAVKAHRLIEEALNGDEGR